MLPSALVLLNLIESNPSKTSLMLIMSSLLPAMRGAEPGGVPGEHLGGPFLRLGMFEPALADRRLAPKAVYIQGGWDSSRRY